MSEVVGEAVIRIGADTTGAERDATRAGGESGKGFKSGFAASLKGLAGLAAAAFATEKVVGFFKGAITGASDLNETLSKTNVVFGSGAQAVIDFAKTGATALGQTQQQALDAASTFGIFGKMAGLAGGDLAKFSTQFTGLASDLASFHNASPEEAIDAIGAALRGEAEPIRRFGVLLDDATLKNEALKLGLIKTTKDALTPQQKVLAAQAVIMKQTQDAQGDFARTSGGLANQQRILSARFSDFRTSLGKVFLPLALEAVKAANFLITGFEKVGPVIKKVGDAFSILTQGDAQGFGEVLDNALGNSGRFVTPLRQVGDAILGFAQIIHDTAAQALPILAAAFQGDILPALKDFMATVQQAAGQVLPVMADTFRNVILPAVTQLGQYLTTNLVPIFQQVAQIIITQVVPTIVELGTFIYGTLYPAVVAIVVAIGQQLKPVFDTLVVVIRDQIVPTVSKLVTQFREELLPVLEPIIVKVVAVTGFLLKLAAVILSTVLPPLLRLVGFLIANLLPAAVKVITIVLRVINTLLSFGGALVQTIAKVVSFGASLVNLVTGAISDVVTAVAALPGKILALAPKMLAAGKAIIGAFVNGLKNAGGVVADIAGNVWDAVRGLLNNAIDRINAALEFKISLPFGKSVGVNPPDIPHLAAGGVVTAPTLALIGEAGPEAVIPLNSPRARLTTTGGGGLDVQALAAAITAAMLAAGIRGGDITIPVTVPTDDPEAVAQRVLNRLVMAGR